MVASAHAENIPDDFSKWKTDWTVQGVLEFPFHSFYLGAPAIHGVAYLPNFVPRLGPRITYKDTGVMVTFGLPIPEAEKTRRGDSTHSGLTINSYWRELALDAYFHKFRGFYASSPFTELSFNKPERYPQLPDARVTVYGLNVYHATNRRAYSFQAAFDFNEIQTKSGGSVVVAPFFNHFAISLGQTFIPGSDPSGLEEMPNLASADMNTFGAGGGYGHTWVFKRGFQASAQGTIGPGLQMQRIKREDGDEFERLGVAVKLNVNVSGGYNSATRLAGAKVLVDSLWAELPGSHVYSSLVNIQLFAGLRF